MDGVHQKFGNKMKYVCQRHNCKKCTKEQCQDKERYPCDRALPTYLREMIDRAIERSEKEKDPRQKELEDFK